MNELNIEKIENEYKVITKYIFQGLTTSEIALKMNCSRSTIANRMTALFEKYSAKTRFEFILGVLGEIVRNNKFRVDRKKRQIKQLQKEKEMLYGILRNIIINKNNKNKFDFWINEAENKLI